MELQQDRFIKAAQRHARSQHTRPSRLRPGRAFHLPHSDQHEAGMSDDFVYALSLSRGGLPGSRTEWRAARYETTLPVFEHRIQKITAKRYFVRRVRVDREGTWRDDGRNYALERSALESGEAVVRPCGAIDAWGFYLHRSDAERRVEQDLQRAEKERQRFRREFGDVWSWIGQRFGLSAAGGVTTAWCWEELGIGRTEDSDAIRRAYRERAKEVHPDAGGTNAKFIRLKRARDQALRLSRVR